MIKKQKSHPSLPKTRERLPSRSTHIKIKGHNPQTINPANAPTSATAFPAPIPAGAAGATPELLVLAALAVADEDDRAGGAGLLLLLSTGGVPLGDVCNVVTVVFVPDDTVV